MGEKQQCGFVYAQLCLYTYIRFETYNHNNDGDDDDIIQTTTNDFN